MVRLSAILLSGLLLWVAPATAEKITTHPLSVSIHEAVRPSVEAECRRLFNKDIEECIDGILKDASDKLQQGQPETRQPGCQVGFSLKGKITTFNSAPADIGDAGALEQAHQVPADVKVVRSINYCVGEFMETGFFGCSWRPPGLQKTVIVIAPLWTGTDPIVWVHEFGHTTGLLHRFEERNEDLMSPCDLASFNTLVNDSECGQLVAGPVRYPPQGQGDLCPTTSSARHRID